MVMRTKVLVFVGLFFVSMLGIASELVFKGGELVFKSGYDFNTYSYSLKAKIFDYGQNIVSIEIDTKGQGKNIQNKQIDKGTFKVFAKGTLPKDAGIVLDDKTKSLGTFEVEREIENIYVNDKGNIIINLKYGKDVVGANTLSYVTGDVSRNVLMDLEYRVEQKKEIKGYKTGFYRQGKIVDEEADKFVVAKSKSGVNYQYFKPVNKDDGKKHPLIIWFHGNGEGGYKGYRNNVSQKLANRGAVAFAEDKTQKIFGGAYIVAPQADDTWYNNYTKGYIKSVKAMIDEFVSENNIDKNRIYIFGTEYNGHWSWIYSLRNMPVNDKGEHLFEWMARQNLKKKFKKSQIMIK